MKPTLLKMTAFGSYAKETIVDFNKLNSGLYLITGDTGAGKTTIFDAMVYALYGKASGDEREAYMLHSDYVPKSEDTIVSLEFIHNDKSYKVERSIHFTKNRSTGEYGDPKQNAVLYEDGKSPIEVSKNVNARISEIIGLDADQFRQIIVLAQGEFQKFLKADSANRNKILGKLFDNTPYVRFESRLKAAADSINKKVAEGKNAIEMKMHELSIPEQEDELLYSIGNPEYLSNIDKLIEKEKLEFERLKDGIQEILNKRDEVAKKLEKARRINDDLDRLDKLAKKMEELVARKESFVEIEKTLEKVEKANNNVKPVKKNFEDAKARLDKNEDDIKTYELKLNEAVTKKTEAEENFLEVADLRTANMKLKTEADNLERVLKEFEPYNMKKTELSNKNGELDVLNQECFDLTEIIRKLEEDKKNNEDKIEELKFEANELANRTTEYDKANTRYNLITGADGLSDRVGLVEDARDDLKFIQKEALKLNAELLAKKDQYDSLYNDFIKSQASILAKELKVELEQNKKAVCPVCKHHLEVEDAQRLDISEDNIVSKAQVDDAHKLYEKAEKNYHSKETEIEKQSEKLNQLINNVMTLSKQLDLDVRTYEDLNIDYLRDLESNALSLKKEAEALLNKSNSAFVETEKLNKKLKEIATNNQVNLNKLNEIKSEVETKKVNIASISAEIKKIEESLNGRSEEDTKTRKTIIETQIENNEKRIKTLTESKDGAVNVFNTISGSLTSLKDNNAAFKREYEHFSSKLSETLSVNGFSGVEEYQKTIDIAGIDVTLWIKEKRNAIQNYQQESRSISDQYNNQKELCKDSKRIDIEEIEKESENIIRAYNEENDKIAGLSAYINNHESVSSFVKDRKKSIGKLLPASQRISKLSNLANASESTDGGKINFDRYVMGNAFVQILNAANIHLSVMASGQYELIHQTRGDHKSSQAGLDIEVLDVFTGEQRKPDSLSGGEKFQVSMALALGLSDVVQNLAGGKKIDTMYIDEGFGTLDEAVLSKAIEVLTNIAGDKRQIGIISHVDRLEESIQQKIVVKKGDKGSSLYIES